MLIFFHDHSFSTFKEAIWDRPLDTILKDEVELIGYRCNLLQTTIISNFYSTTMLIYLDPFGLEQIVQAVNSVLQGIDVVNGQCDMVKSIAVCNNPTDYFTVTFQQLVIFQSWRLPQKLSRTRAFDGLFLHQRDNGVHVFLDDGLGRFRYRTNIQF
eukprot:TRINITY_DN13863_c0_g1_i1.p2 TRINITY_DN13863_c0_g1~~TRINITY_DN13863_c0_g1_i1.p2  ORF type:complete len:156 (+),score=5.53 TRINITY_DN13863_c0_g1_i1:484-951(+)